MHCGAIMSEENLDTTTLLQNELKKANDMIAVLKQSLEMTLTAAEQKTEFAIECRRLKSENQKLNDTITEKQATIDTQKSKLSQSTKLYNKLNASYDALRETFPIKITRIELGNENINSAIISDFGSTLFSSKLQYLVPKIYFFNYLKEGKTFAFEIHYYNSSWELQYNRATGKKPASENYISPITNNVTLSGWGNNSANYWKAGTYTIEIWTGGVCLGSSKFTIF